MAYPIVIVGIGPGSPEYMTPVALKYIHEAEALVGGERNLDGLLAKEQECFVIRNNLKEMTEYIKKASESKRVTVLASGDPNFYGIVKYLKKHLPTYEFQIVPGISSFQLACARLLIHWEDAVFFSAHGRDTAGLVELVRSNKKVIVLTDPENNPTFIGTKLVEAGMKDKIIYVCENLSYANERIEKFSLPMIPSDTDNKACVMVICDE